MAHAVPRVFSFLAALLVAFVTLLGVAAPASAADDQLGWLRLTPPTGSVNGAVDALTEKPCPGGSAVVVGITGPGVPTQGDVGYIVGNTELAALTPTESGQLYVPLSLTFRDWFARNMTSREPEGTYTISLVCRDSLRASLTYGAFIARVTLPGDGTYAALGDAAKPFDTVLRPGDPLPGIVSASAAPTSDSSATSSDSSTEAKPTSAPSPTIGAGAESTADTGRDPSSVGVVAGAPTSVAGGGGTPSLLFVGLGALLVVGVAILIARSRAARPAATTSARHLGGT